MSDFRQLRKKLFVSQEIQGRLLGRLALYWIVYHAILWHAMFLTQWINAQIQNLNGTPAPRLFPAYWEFVSNNQLLPLVAAAIFPVVVWDMLKLSHRIAGPLVQLRNRLRDMAMGKPANKLRMRHGDLLLEIQTAFNDYIESLQTGKQVDHSQKADAGDDPVERLLTQVQALQAMSSKINAEQEKSERQETPAPAASRMNTN